MSSATSLPGNLAETFIPQANSAQTIRRDFSFGSLPRQTNPPERSGTEEDTITLGNPQISPLAYRPDQETIDEEGIIAHALGDDPKLLSQINFILQFLRKYSPDLAKAFLKSLHAGMDGTQESNEVKSAHTVSAQAVSSRTSSIMTFSRLEIEIQYSSKTEVSSTSDGKSVSKENVVSAQITIRFTSAAAQSIKADPIVLDLDGNGIQASGMKDGIPFDINADGKLDLTSFILGGDGLLALDRNRNGKIDNGSELFGDQRGAANGFEELRKLDENQDGVIDSKDSSFAKLSLLSAKSCNPGELQLTSLAQAGVAALRLAYQTAEEKINADVSVAQKGSFTRTDGNQGLAADLLLTFRKVQ